MIRRVSFQASRRIWTNETKFHEFRERFRGRLTKFLDDGFEEENGAEPRILRELYEFNFPSPRFFTLPSSGLAKRPIIQPWIGVRSVVGRWSPVAATFSKIVPILVPSAFCHDGHCPISGEIIHHSTGYHFPYLGRIEFPTDPRPRKITILIRIWEWGKREKD